MSSRDPKCVRSRFSDTCTTAPACQQRPTPAGGFLAPKDQSPHYYNEGYKGETGKTARGFAASMLLAQAPTAWRLAPALQHAATQAALAALSAYASMESLCTATSRAEPAATLSASPPVIPTCLQVYTAAPAATRWLQHQQGVLLLPRCLHGYCYCYRCRQPAPGPRPEQHRLHHARCQRAALLTQAAWLPHARGGRLRTRPAPWTGVPVAATPPPPRCQQAMRH
jgi:hypothetical protein